MMALTGAETFATTAGGTVVAGVVAYLLNRRKQNADSTQVLTDIALSLVEPLRDQVRELEKRVDRAEKREHDALREVATTKLEFSQYRTQSRKQISQLESEVHTLTVRLAAYESAPPGK